MPDRPTDLTTRRRLAVVAVATVLQVTLAVVARYTTVTGTELDVFRWFNDWPDAIARPLWVVMQLGSLIGGMAVGALVMGLLRGWVGALVGAVTAAAAWALAVLTKAWVSRGRPADYLGEVQSRFAHLPTGNGYPSGHTTVAFAVATLVAGSLPPRWRIAPYVLATLVGFARLYFGAHLPLDVIGGAALGVAVGTLTSFLLSDPDSRTRGEAAAISP